MNQQRSGITYRRIFRYAWRGLTKACARCGQRGLFERWLTMKERCPNCGLQFEREEGYWTGAIAANLIVTQFTFVILMIVSLVLTWSDPPVRELIIGAIAFNILFPIFFYPFSKTIWMAFDRAFNPSDQPFDDGDPSPA